MKNKWAHWVKGRKRTIQTFDERWILDYILFITCIFIVHRVFIFTNTLCAYWLVSIFSYPTAPGEQIIAHLPLWNSPHIYREYIPSLELQHMLQKLRSGSKATTYSSGRSGFHHRKPMILLSAGQERDVTFCHEVVPSLNPYSHFCIVPEWSLYPGICQAVVKLHSFLLFQQKFCQFSLFSK